MMPLVEMTMRQWGFLARMSGSSMPMREKKRFAKVEIKKLLQAEFVNEVGHLGNILERHLALRTDVRRAFTVAADAINVAITVFSRSMPRNGSRIGWPFDSGQCRRHYRCGSGGVGRDWGASVEK